MNIFTQKPTKPCKACKQTLPLSEFGRKGPEDSGALICKNCNRVRSRLSYQSRKGVRKVQYTPSTSKYVMDQFQIEEYRVNQQLEIMSQARESYRFSFQLRCALNHSQKEDLDIWWLATLNQTGFFLVFFQDQIRLIPRSAKDIVRFAFKNGFEFDDRQSLKSDFLPKINGPIDWRGLGFTVYHPRNEPK